MDDNNRKYSENLPGLRLTRDLKSVDTDSEMLQ